jgi:hypothetical protein
MSAEVRAAVDRALAANPTIGPSAKDWPLFPAPRSGAKAPKAWSRFHARALLERAEKEANVPPLQGSDFHAYRRKWAAERKHLPEADVAAAGGWRDRRSLQTAYQHADERTMLAVVMSPTKLRDIEVAAG